MAAAAQKIKEFTQADVARALEVTEGHLSMVLRGRRESARLMRLYIRQLKSWAKVYGAESIAQLPHADRAGKGGSR